jgi:hypothetical protein
MAKFDDTPDYKRRAHWNPVTQRLEYPATDKQIRFIKRLCAAQGREYVAPASLTEAKGLIDSLLAHGRRKRS